VPPFLLNRRLLL
jgi:hypothetical protein